MGAGDDCGTIGNYEYCFNWVFHQDGALEVEIMLTGIMLVKGVTAQTETDHQHGDKHGHLVAPNIEAPHHQHFFNFRLDLDIDGAGANSIVEQNTMASLPGKANPQNNAFTMKETVFKRELEAQRQLNFATVRRWKIINAEAKNALGQAPGYLLVTGENSPSFSGLNSWVRRRAGFLDHHLWVTPYAPEEMYSAGDYINQNRGGEGLPAWTKANRSIEKQDLVLWYTMGVTHIPRPEDWPVMPVHKTGFKLIPNGFFTRNPDDGFAAGASRRTVKFTAQARGTRKRPGSGLLHSPFREGDVVPASAGRNGSFRLKPVLHSALHGSEIRAKNGKGRLPLLDHYSPRLCFFVLL
ncbi:MAG: hypothetical protein U0Y68_12890 [Blastocatellia bacterium]